MSEQAASGVSYVAVCPECGEKRTVMRDVPWRDDVCISCGAAVNATSKE